VPYFTTEELRALPDLPDPGRFNDGRLDAAHDWIASIIERECDTSFIPVEKIETLNGTGSSDLMLSSPYVLSIDSVSVDGSALDAPALAALVVQHGAVYTSAASSYWSSTTRANVVIAYTAGYSTTPPADLKEAAMRAARNWLLTSDAWSGKDSRATAISNDFGNIALSVAGPDRPTGLPDVDATIMAWAERTRLPGFA
jgi:hypothetical protein